MIDRFHAHLDVCEQCRNHPFNLCPLGDRLLHSAAQEAAGDNSIREKGEIDPTDAAILEEENGLS
jgi:hypothetical protein